MNHLNNSNCMIAASQSKIFDFQMHIMITADAWLISKKVQLKNYMESMEMQAMPPYVSNRKDMKSILPIFDKQDIENRLLH